MVAVFHVEHTQRPDFSGRSGLVTYFPESHGASVLVEPSLLGGSLFDTPTKRSRASSALQDLKRLPGLSPGFPSPAAPPCR